MNCKNRNDLILRNAGLKKGDAALHWFGHAGAAAPHSFRGQSARSSNKKGSPLRRAFFIVKNQSTASQLPVFSKNSPKFYNLGDSPVL